MQYIVSFEYNSKFKYLCCINNVIMILAFDFVSHVYSTSIKKKRKQIAKSLKKKNT